MDKEKIKEGVRLILDGIGEDIQREGLLETPDRIARMYEELAAGYTDSAAKHLQKRFHVDNNDMFWKRIFISIPSVSIICFLFMEMQPLLIFQMEKW